MFFRFYLINDESNNTIIRFVNALVKSAQLPTKELKKFLLTCFDRNINFSFIELSLEMLIDYLQSLRAQIGKIDHARNTANAFIEASLDEATENEPLREKLFEIQARIYGLNKKNDEVNATVLIIEELIQKLERKRDDGNSTDSNATNNYFDISYEEYLLYERYKGMSIDFHHFFAAFKAQGQNHLKPPKERLESLLKYQFEEPKEDDVLVVLVEDESPAILPQFENLSLVPVDTSVSTSFCNANVEVKSRFAPS